MALKYKTRAFIFKKDDLNEADRIFSVFTDDFGRLDIFAKAIRKTASKLRSGIDTFFMSEIEFIQGKNRKTLTDASKIEKFDNIFQDLEKYKIANKIGEVLDNFLKGQEKDKAVFDLLIEIFSKLEDNSLKTKNHQLVYQYFFWNFLSLQGYKSEVNNCAACQSKLNPYNIYFSNKGGGIVCKKCSTLDKNSRKINSDVAKILRLIFKKNWQIISKLKVEPSSQKLLEDISENTIHAFCPACC
jgi:DNA repair protein RecO (recombination protein O)